MSDREYIQKLLELKKSEIVNKMLLDKTNKRISEIKFTEDDLIKPHLSSLFIHNVLYVFLLAIVITINYVILENVFSLFFESVEALNFSLTFTISVLSCYFYIPTYWKSVQNLKDSNERKLKEYDKVVKTYERKVLLISKLECIKHDLKEAKESLHNLYTEKDFAVKYRNLCDLVILNNYFDSGRCDSLEEAFKLYFKEGMFIHKEHINEDALDLKTSEVYCKRNIPSYYITILDLRESVDEMYKNNLLKNQNILVNNENNLLKS